MEFYDSAGDVLEAIWNVLKSDNIWGSLSRAAVIGLLTAALIKLITVVFRRLERARLRRGQTIGLPRIIEYILIVSAVVLGLAAIISGNAKKALSTLLASSGIAAVVLSIACQEPIGNLCSGVITLLSSPYKIGNYVRFVATDEIGMVEQVTLRHTVILTYENKRLVIPNSEMNKAVIENADYGGNKVCVPIEFPVTFETDLDRARELIAQVVLTHPDFDEDEAKKTALRGEPPAMVLVNRFEQNGVVLKVWIWSKNLDASYVHKSDIQYGVWVRFRKNGISFAHPRVRLIGGLEEPHS